MIGDTATGGDLDALARRVSDRRMKRGLVTMGETMACISGVGPLSTGQTMILRAAGAESNVAIGVARLGHKARIAGGPGFDDLDDLDARLEHLVPTIGDGRHRSCIRDRVIVTLMHRPA